MSSRRKQRKEARELAERKRTFVFDPVRPKNEIQEQYLYDLYNYDLVFGVGEAGTGKTFLAINVALNYLSLGRIKKIFLVRPAIESGERLGYLPGGVEEKMEQFLLPIYDSISKAGTNLKTVEPFIEIAPLAYMRGRTLDHCAVVLDEAQNTTPKQMLMFLTRLGENCKAFVTGDPKQTDIPFDNGLSVAVRRLKNMPGCAITEFTEEDVVRSRIVSQVLEHWHDD